jgi:putative ABC transport system permease protein
MRRVLSLRLAYHHVRCAFGRVALSIAAVALGVALVVAIRLMNAAVLDSFLDTLDGTAGKAHLTVSAGEGMTFPEDVFESVARVSGVKLAVPLVTAVAFPADGSGELLTVHGVDLTNDAAVRTYQAAGDSEEIIDDLTLFLSQPDSIVLGEQFASARGLVVGSTLDLVTPRGVKRFTVRGPLCGRTRFHGGQAHQSSRCGARGWA